MIKQKPGLMTFILAIGVFGILNTEMGVVGIIPEVSQYFEVSVVDAALLVSGFALVVAAAGPTMPLLFSKVNRKTVMLLSLGVFTVCNTAAVFAPSFEVLMALRVIPAAFHPLYVSMALAVASQMGDAKQAAKASARVFVGVSAGMVVGAPVAALLASVISFEASMAFFAVVTAAVFVMTVFLVPTMPVEKRISYSGQIAVLKKPLLWMSLISVIALNGAMFGFYGYLADFLSTVSGLGVAGVSAMLLVYGLANIVGNLIAGRTLASRAAQTIAVIPFALGVAFAVLFLVGQLSVGSVIAVSVLGVFVGIANNVNQYLVSTAAPEAPDFANGLYLTAANLGVTAGTALCGVFIAAADTRFALIGSLVLVAAAIVLISVRQILARRMNAVQASIPAAVRSAAKASR